MVMVNSSEAVSTATLKPFKTRRAKALLVVLELFFILLNIVFFVGIGKKWLFTQTNLTSSMNFAAVKDSTSNENQINNVNVLVFGVDSVEGTHRSDTLFVLGLNPAKGRISMISIPRDTRVLINGKSRKINEILPRYGEFALRNLIEDLMQIKISRYLKVDFQGFINIIDVIGGVDIDLDKSMHYDDNWGKLHIHFNKGMNHLDGRDALNYVRFRADASADLGRIKRQQKFIRELLKKAFQPGFVVKLPQVVKEAFSHVDTDFTIQEIFSVIGGFKDFKAKFRTSSLPGEARYIDKISYFLPYKDKAVELGAREFSDLAAIELVASFSSNIATGTKNEN
jgi:LCP family protein required for cell wall assembly